MSKNTKNDNSHKIGEGSYGAVYHNGTQEAIKRNFVNTELSFSGAIREADLLSRLSHPFVIHLRKIIWQEDTSALDIIMTPVNKMSNSRKDDSLHFLFQKANCDLHHYLLNEIPKRNKQCKDYKRLVIFMAQLLLGIEYFHANDIIHRDLKPSNILYFTEDSDNKVKECVKIADLGLATPFTYQGHKTPNVVTFLFRAPEIILGNPYYDYRSDIWSLGCIFYQMISNLYYITNMVDNDNTLISSIYGNLEENLANSDYQNLINNPWKPISLINSIAFPAHRTPLAKKLAMTDQEIQYFEQQTGCNFNAFLDLLRNMLKFDYNQRYTATQCLKHPFFKGYNSYICEVHNIFYKTISPQFIHLVNCPERIWMIEIINLIYETRTNKKQISVMNSWFSHRIIFQAVDLFDRYLYIKYQSPNKIILKNKLNKAYNGTSYSLFTRYGTRIRFLGCIYFCYKYFLTIKNNITFQDFIASIHIIVEQEVLPIVENFERDLLKSVLDYGFYRPTIYEAADYFSYYLTEADVLMLLCVYFYDAGTHNSTPYKLFGYYFKHIKDKIPYIKHLPVITNDMIPF